MSSVDVTDLRYIRWLERRCMPTGSMFVPAGARERNGLSVIVRDFVIIARNKRERKRSGDK